MEEFGRNGIHDDGGWEVWRDNLEEVSVSPGLDISHQGDQVIHVALEFLPQRRVTDVAENFFDVLWPPIALGDSQDVGGSHAEALDYEICVQAKYTVDHLPTERLAKIIQAD